MAFKNKLSIYMIKPGIINPEDIFDNYDDLVILKEYTSGAIAYYTPSRVHTPEWLETFFHIDNMDMLMQSDSRVVLLYPISVSETIQMFALTFGYAKCLLKESILVEDFGFKMVLNCIEQNQIKRITKYCIGSNKKLSDEQMPRSSEITDFGFDINRDLMRRISGRLAESIPCIGGSMVMGGDIFSVSVEMDIYDIGNLLRFCYDRYHGDAYVRNFPWVDNIKPVKENSIIERLNELFVEALKSRDYTNAWIDFPEVLGENIKGFRIPGQKEYVDDVSIDYVIESYKNELNRIEQLKQKKIIAYSSFDSEVKVGTWTVWNCLSAELSLAETSYILSRGKWYSISEDYKKIINEEYNSIHLFQTAFPDFVHKDEDSYNEELCKSLEGAKLLHKKCITIEGKSSVEICDVEWRKKLIHIKRGKSSQEWGHLSNQVLVSGQALLDPEIRRRIGEKVFPFEEPFSAQEYEFVLGMIGKKVGDRPSVPFFSKVTICYAIKTLKSFGYSVSMIHIKDDRKTNK